MKNYGVEIRKPESYSISDLSFLSKRAQLDFKIRKEILYAWKTKQSRIVIPKIKRSLWFWKWYAKKVTLLRRGTPTFTLIEDDRFSGIGGYRFQKGAILAYSGGAESTLIRNMMTSLDQFTITATAVKDGVFTHPVEGALAIIGAGMGYGATMFGSELEIGEKVNEQEPDRTKYFEAEKEFQWRWKLYSGGAAFLAPLHGMTKVQVVEKLIDAKLEFFSCIWGAKRWCKRCCKCIEIYYIYRMLGKEPPFKKVT